MNPIEWLKSKLAPTRREIAKPQQVKTENAKQAYAREAAEEAKTTPRIESLSAAVKQESIDAAGPVARLMESATKHRDNKPENVEAPTDANLQHGRSHMKGRARGISR